MIRVDGQKGIYVEVVAKSISEHGDTLTTFRLHYPRIIHGELMTHRMFSRNASSSRAIPVKRVLDQVQKNPAMPVQFGKNQSGMQDAGKFDDKIPVEIWDEYKEELVTHYLKPEEVWQMSADSASEFAQAFSKAGYHKQVANRLLEPYQYMNTIVSMTDIDNFFHLRLHKDADPTFINLTECIYDAYNQSTPEIILDGDYHLPFIEKRFDVIAKELMYFADDIQVDLETAIKVSISVCAQVSYRKSDFSTEKALKIYNMLVTMNPIHGSALEHIAKPFTNEEWLTRNQINDIIAVNEIIGLDAMYCANFKGWEMHRKYIHGENITTFTGDWDIDTVL